MTCNVWAEEGNTHGEPIQAQEEQANSTQKGSAWTHNPAS